MKKLILGIFTLSAIVLAGCSTTPHKYGLDDPNIKSILVVPAVNKTTEAAAGDFLVSAISVPLAERGYYPYPINTVKTVLQHEGMYEPEKIQQQSPAELCKMFSADSVLYIEIEEMSSSYGVISTTTTAKVKYTMYNQNGIALFSKEYTSEYDPSGNNDSIGAVLVNMIVSAVERADPSFLIVSQDNTLKMTRDQVAPGYYLLKQQGK